MFISFRHRHRPAESTPLPSAAVRLSNKTKRLAVGGAALAAAALVAGCGSGIPGDSVASVAGNPITTRALNHWMYVAEKGNVASAPGAPVIVPTDPPKFDGCLKQVRAQIPSLAKTSDTIIRADCANLFQSLNSEVLGYLIQSYWWQADAAKLHIKVTDAEIQKQFETAKKQAFPTDSAYQTYLTQTGQTQADILYRFRTTQVQKQLVAHETQKVTPAAISKYYADHQSQFGTPETRNIRIVRTNTEGPASAALAALKAGQSWSAVAKQYSVDAGTKNNGGQLVDVTNGEEEHALNQAAFTAPLNTIEGPVHGTFGWYVVEVTKITQATHQTLAQATPLIKQLLTSNYQTAAQTAVTKLSQKNWGSQTLCRSAYSITYCHGYKAPSTTTTPTPTATTTTPTATTSTTTPTTTTGSAKKK